MVREIALRYKEKILHSNKLVQYTYSRLLLHRTTFADQVRRSFKEAGMLHPDACT